MRDVVNDYSPKGKIHDAVDFTGTDVFVAILELDVLSLK